MPKWNKVKTNRLYVYGGVVDHRGNLMPASYGAGILGTEFGPRKYQWKENDHIITEFSYLVRKYL